MTEKRNKDIIMLIYLTVLTVIALVYGFMTIPNPSDQRKVRLDQQRVTDLGQLQYAIDDQYRLDQALPETINDIRDNSYSPSQSLIKTDPETGASYEYKMGTPMTYQLCATFTTDSEKEKMTADENNYSYASFKSKFPHGIGKKCFDFEVYPANNYPINGVWPSYTPVRGGAQMMDVPVGEKPASPPATKPAMAAPQQDN